MYFGGNTYFGPNTFFGSPGVAPPAVSEAFPTVQRPVISLKADWNRDGVYTGSYEDLSGVVTSATVERSITGDLPPEVSLVEGYASAQLTVVLGGTFADGTDVFTTFTPYRSDSALWSARPLTGINVICDMGLVSDSGPNMVRQFTGLIRSVRVNSLDQTVTIVAMDYVDKLHATITLPNYGQPRGNAISYNYKFTVNSQAIIDYVLRRNGIYASPPPVSTAQLSLTGHGWLVAEIGRSTYPYGAVTPVVAQAWSVPGPFGMLAVRGIWDSTHNVKIECFTENKFTMTAGTGIGYSLWTRIGTGLDGIIPNTTRKYIEILPTIGAPVFELRVSDSAGTTTVTAAMFDVTDYLVVSQVVSTPIQWTWVGVHFQFGLNGTLTASLRVNGVTATTTAASPTAFAYLRDQVWAIVHTDARDWSNLQIWYDYIPPTAGAWPGESWTPQANIAAGYNEMTHLPDIVNADSWQVIQDVTKAEYATGGFDASGTFNWTARTAPPNTNSTAKTITAATALLDLTLETNSDAIRNVVTTTTTASYLSPGSVVNSSDPVAWETPVGVRTYKIPLPYGAIGPVEIQAVSPYTTAAWNANSNLLEGYVAVIPSSPGTEINPSAQVYVHFAHVTDAFALAQIPDTTSSAFPTAVPTGNRVGLLKVENYTNTPVRFSTTSASAALRIQGWLLTAEPTVSEIIQNPNSVPLIGARVFAIPTSPYRQLIAPLRPVAVQLLTQLANPLPIVDAMSVIGDPAVGLNAIVSIVDTQGQGVFRASVVKVVRTFSDQGLFDTLTVRPIAPPGLGITDDNTIGIADSTLIAGP